MSVNALQFDSNLNGDNYQVLEAIAGQSIDQWLDANNLRDVLYQQPTVVEVNNRQLCEADYGYVLKDGDHVALITLSQGPLAAIPLMVWVAVAAVAITALVLPGMMEPDIPGAADQKEGSPLYSTSVKGNRYRPGSKGAILYGTTRVIPDFSQLAFSEFDSEDQQHYFMRFRITQGIASVDLNSAKFNDTPLSNFTDVEIEHILPGQKSVLVPKRVINSDEVTDIELDDDPTSSYVVCGVGEKVNRIGIDLSAQALYNQDREDGDLRWYTVKTDVQAQLIDDTGAPLGAWQTLGQAVLSNGDPDPMRRSFTYQVSEGRYQVRLDRVTPKNDSQYVQDTVRWIGLKGYEQDDATSTCTEVAVVMRSSNQVGNRALTNFSVIASRHLPIWNDVNGWSVEQQTNHFAWALADLCRNDYAGRRADAHYKLARLAEFAARPDLANAEFNAYYDTEGVSVWDALEQAGMPGRVKVIDYAGQYWFVRDEAQATSVQQFTMRNIVRGSYAKKAPNFVTESADSVVVKFRDKTADYEWYNDGDGLLCKVPESPGLNPREVTLFGVDDPTEAKKIGMWLAASSAYRRIQPQFQTGLEGRIPFYGRQVTVSHFVLGYEGREQISGDVLAIDAGAAEVDISEPVPAGLTEPRIVFRYGKGEPSEAFEVTVLGADRMRVRVLPIPDSGPGIMPDWSQIRVGSNGEEDTQFALGDGVEFMDKVKVVRARRNGNKVQLQGYVDDPRVYLLSDDVTPPAAYNPPGKESLVPVVRNLQAGLVGTAADPSIVLSWEGVNCDYYEVEMSDDGINFVPYGSKSISNRLTIAVEPGHYYFKVYGYNLLRGAPAATDIQTSTVAEATPPAPVNLALREAFTGPTLKVQWEGYTKRHRVAVYVGVVEKYAVVLEAGTEWDFAGALAQENGIGRGFDVRVYSVGENGLLSDTYAELAVYNNPPAALANLVVDSAASTAIVAFDWPSGSTDLAGISVWAAGTSGFTPGAGNLVVDRSKNPVVDVPIPDGTLYLVAAAVDVWGDSSLNFSGEYSVSPAGMVLGPDSVGEENLKANSVTAAKMLVLTLSSIVANLGTVTAGLFKTVAGIGKRLEIEGGSRWPFWLGVGDKNAANGTVYYDEFDESWNVRDPASGFYEKSVPGDDIPWKVSNSDGSKYLRFNKLTGALEGRGLTILDDTGNVLLASGTGLDWSDISGAAKPADNATVNDFSDLSLVAGSLAYNPNGQILAADGRPAGWYAAYDNNDSSSISHDDSEKAIVLHHSSDSSIGMAGAAFKVVGGAVYTIHVRVKSDVASASGFYFRIQEFDGVLPAEAKFISSVANVSELGAVEDTRQIQTFRENQSITTDWVEFVFEYTATETAEYASPLFLNWTGMGTSKLFVDYCYIAQEKASEISGQGGFATLDKVSSSNATTFIDSAAMNELQLAGQSIVIEESVASPGVVTHSSRNSWYNTGLSRSITMANALSTSAVNIRASLNLSFSETGGPNVHVFQIRLLRNGSVVSGSTKTLSIKALPYEWDSFTNSISKYGQDLYIPYELADKPGAGSFSYVLQIRRTSSWSGAISSSQDHNMVLGGGKR